ncbi:hypothetical protein Emed_006981 [Eimeria media]
MCSQQLLEGFVCFYFLAAAAAAAAAARWPTFAALAAHGKVRQHAINTHSSSNSSSNSNSSSSKSSSSNSSNTSSTALRLLQRLRTQTCSKRRFVDFYLIGSFLTCCCLLRLLQQQQQQWQSLPLVLLLLHLLRRLGEQLLLVASDDSSRMHLAAYFLGCTYYVATPLACFLSAKEASRSSKQQKVISLVIWLGANCVQFASHVVLANLRRQGQGPEGGPSKPHFVSEGVEGSDGCMTKGFTQGRRSSSSSSNISTSNSSRSSNSSSRSSNSNSNNSNSNNSTTSNNSNSSNNNSSRSSSSSNNSSRSRSSNSSSSNNSSSSSRGSSSVGAPKYGIPGGPLFAYTSCPHYLAEVFVYLSLFLSAPSIPL